MVAFSRHRKSLQLKYYCLPLCMHWLVVYLSVFTEYEPDLPQTIKRLSRLVTFVYWKVECYLSIGTFCYIESPKFIWRNKKKLLLWTTLNSNQILNLLLNIFQEPLSTNSSSLETPIWENRFNFSKHTKLQTVLNERWNLHINW